ncbi:hypothetical protein [Actinocorallia populi]|uniref:hypothetical protein n=1 Tax=Actinocorallia populi TaxID=2079200 RepID=UPI000D090A94|nr:hypothetical protein [Actinocorallia populi]
MADPNPPSSLDALLNQSTPYAPEDENERARRLAAANAPSSGTPAGEAPPRERHLSELSTAFVPTMQEAGPNERPRYQLREMVDGTAGLAVYTSLELLKERLGADQPWAEAPLIELLYIVGRDKIGVVLNPHLMTEDGRGDAS